MSTLPRLYLPFSKRHSTVLSYYQSATKWTLDWGFDPEILESSVLGGDGGGNEFALTQLTLILLEYRFAVLLQMEISYWKAVESCSGFCVSMKSVPAVPLDIFHGLICRIS